MAEKNFALVNQSLKITKDNLTESEWEAIGKSLGRGLDNWHWVVGDWMLFGEDKFGKTVWANHQQPGVSMYDRAAMITGLDPELIQRCTRVARHYPPENRIPGVSWSRHLQGIALPEARRYEILRKSGDEDWSLEKWHKALGTKPPNGAALTSDIKRTSIKCPHCGEIISPSEIKDNRVQTLK